MAKYLLLIYGEEPPAPPTPAQVEAMFGEYEKFTVSVEQQGILRGAEALLPTSAATTVRVRDGKNLVTDGPFAETKELIAGYTLIQVRSEEEARAWASRFPMPFVGMACEIEVRRLYEDADFAPGGDMALRSE